MVEIIKKDGEIIKYLEPDELIKKSILINYNDNLIDIVGELIFVKSGSNNLISKVLNPGFEFIELSEVEFNEFLQKIVEFNKEEGVIAFDSKLVPVKSSILNTKVLKDRMISLRLTDDTIYVNNYILTTDGAEFHGSGMFSSKNVIFLNYDKLAKVREILES